MDYEKQRKQQFQRYETLRNKLNAIPASVRVAAILWNWDANDDADDCVVRAAHLIHWIQVMRRLWIRHDVADGLERKYDDEYDYREELMARYA